MNRATTAAIQPPLPELIATIKALALPGVAGGRLRKAIEAHGDAVAAFPKLAAQVWPTLSEAERDRVRGWARTAVETVRREGYHVLTPAMREYPPRLRHLHSPPEVVFAAGRLELLSAACVVAVVGTRRCTPAGIAAATRIAGGIAAAGHPVISGLALGIDGAAHKAAGPSRTVGVLGCGLDVCYPREHSALQAAIRREGLLLSEQLPGAPPEAHNFPRRNRILAALAHAVVVVEAPVKSGAMITGEIGLAMGRDVFAVPGSLDRANSAGSNQLIRQGAALITGPREILTEMEAELPPEGAEDEVPPPELYGVGLALWRSLGPEPRHIDEIAAETGLDARRSLASLLSLEIQGYAEQLPGLRFVRVPMLAVPS